MSHHYIGDYFANTMDRFLCCGTETILPLEQSVPSPPQTVPHFTYSDYIDNDTTIHYTKSSQDLEMLKSSTSNWDLMNQFQPMTSTNQFNRVQNMLTRSPGRNSPYPFLPEFLSDESPYPNLIEPKNYFEPDKTSGLKKEDGICHISKPFKSSLLPEVMSCYENLVKTETVASNLSNLEPLQDSFVESPMGIQDSSVPFPFLTESQVDEIFAVFKPSEFVIEQTELQLSLINQTDIPKQTEEPKVLEVKELLSSKPTEKVAPILQEAQVNKPIRRRPGRPRKNLSVTQFSNVSTSPPQETKQECILPERKAKLRCLNFSYDEPPSPSFPEKPTKRSKICIEEDNDYFPEEEPSAEVKTKEQKKIDREKNNKASKKSRDKKKEMQIQQERLRDRLLEEHSELEVLVKRLEDALTVLSKKS